jgi:hypothetical protein
VVAQAPFVLKSALDVVPGTPRRGITALARKKRVSENDLLARNSLNVFVNFVSPMSVDVRALSSYGHVRDRDREIDSRKRRARNFARASLRHGAIAF